MNNALIMLLLFSAPAFANVVDGGAVDSKEMGAVWKQVILGNDGLVVKTTLTGKMAEKAMTTTGSTGPITVYVSRVKKYKDAGCARIRMAYHIPGASLKNGGKHDADFDYEQNFCLNGKMPNDSIDMSKW